MGHLRTFETGEHAPLAARLVSQVTAAKICLLNPARKTRYDEHLRARMPEAVVVDVPEEDAPKPAASGTGSAEPAASGTAEGFGEYDLLERIASGRTGHVYKARHRTMGRVVAIKLLSPDAERSPGRVERFRRKAKVLAQLHHPNLPAVYDAGIRDAGVGDAGVGDAGVGDATHFLIMEYVDGWDLAEVVRQHGPLPPDVAVDYVVQAAAGLGCAHACGIVHRNVKPGNLLVDTEGTVKVIGFGIARIAGPAASSEPEVNQDLTLPGKHLGTPNYMAPEQAVDAHGVDPRADVYSLGCTLHTLLTGRPPYPAKTPGEKLQAHRQSPVPSLRSRRAEVPPELDAVFQRMIAKLPAERPQSMDEVIAELQAGPPQDENS
jgi:serine/threonine protein kinase